MKLEEYLQTWQKNIMIVAFLPFVYEIIMRSKQYLSHTNLKPLYFIKYLNKDLRWKLFPENIFKSNPEQGKSKNSTHSRNLLRSIIRQLLY